MPENDSIIMGLAEKRPNTILQITAGDLCDFAHQLALSVIDIVRSQNKNDSENELLTIEEVEAILKVSKMTLWRWNKSGQLKRIDIGGVPRYRRSDIERLLENNANQSKTGSHGK